MFTIYFTQLMQSLPFFLKGLWGTIAVSGLSLLAGTVVGLMLGIIRASRCRRWASNSKPFPPP
jgi:polar amino acid transport system permease protein